MMKPIRFQIHNHDHDVVSSFFGESPPALDEIIECGDGVTLQFAGETKRRGFMETTFLLQLAITIPVGIATSVVSSLLVDKIKSHLRAGDTISIDTHTIKVEGMDTLKQTLEELLNDARKRNASTPQ